MKVKAPMNLDEVEELKPVPKGQYLCKVKKAEVKESKSGNPMIVWSFVIQEPEEHRGKSPFFYNSVITEKTLPWLKTDLVALGIEWDGAEFEPQDGVGNDVIVIADVEDSNSGKPMNVVKGLLPFEE